MNNNNNNNNNNNRNHVNSFVGMNHNNIHKKRQTTVLIGGSNGNAVLCSILGDRSNPINEGHTIRVCTRDPSRFLNNNNSPRLWRCNEQRAFDLFPWEVLPSSWTTHVGAPDCVIGYQTNNDDNNNNDNDELNGMERAISGIGTEDDGGQADLIMLCCPVGAHLDILRRVARALYRLQERGMLNRGSSSSSASPLIIGTLYGGGGFDWMSRIAFAKERPANFRGTWDRQLALFALKAFPYLCKSLEPGKVTLYGRYPQLLGAICPSTPRVRSHAKILLERLLQSSDTGKHLEFLGISCKAKLGGDGSAVLADAAQTAAYVAVHKNASTPHKDPTTTTTTTTTTNTTTTGAVIPSSIMNNHITTATATANVPVMNVMAKPMADHADPHSVFGFLTCTINCTNQFLHPGIASALFHDPVNPHISDKDGTIPWDASKQKTPIPRFYGDGGGLPAAGRLMIDMGVIESYPIMACLDQMLAPAGMQPICSQHGGEPFGRLCFNILNNHPKEAGERSGLVEMALRLQELQQQLPSNNNNGKNQQVLSSMAKNYTLPDKKNVINCAGLLAWSLSAGLSHNSRLGGVLAPAIVVPNDDPNDKSIKKIRPNVKTRFFTDDLPHGLCIQLGLAELLGFDLERDMEAMLRTVRRLQRWMGKEYVVPAHKMNSSSSIKIVADAKDVSETSAPQAFGVSTMQEFQTFLKLSPFAENYIQQCEQSMFQSPKLTSMQTSKL